jgi:hypothetical protein
MTGGAEGGGACGARRIEVRNGRSIGARWAPRSDAALRVDHDTASGRESLTRAGRNDERVARCVEVRLLTFDRYRSGQRSPQLEEIGDQDPA